MRPNPTKGKSGLSRASGVIKMAKAIIRFWSMFRSPGEDPVAELAMLECWLTRPTYGSVPLSVS